MQYDIMDIYIESKQRRRPSGLRFLCFSVWADFAGLMIVEIRKRAAGAKARCIVICLTRR
jgi:hypothetical protein